MRSTSCSSGTRCISGAWLASRRTSNVWRVNRWKQTPGCTRPARPRRCLALDTDTGTSSRDSRRRVGSYRVSFMRPQSTTKPQSSTVMDVWGRGGDGRKN